MSKLDTSDLFDQANRDGYTAGVLGMKKDRNPFMNVYSDGDLPVESFIDLAGAWESGREFGDYHRTVHGVVALPVGP